MIKKILSAIIFSLVFANHLLAQRPNVEMAEGLRASGKIYVVVVVIAIIFAGIIAYMIHLDRKISKLEKEKK
jgi:CcmD family protein